MYFLPPTSAVETCINILKIVSMLSFLLSCGSIKKAAIDTTSSLLYKASNEIETEKNWESFRRGVPANLKMVDGLLYVEQENQKFLATLIKGYCAYAFIVNETLHLKDVLADNDRIFNKNQAIFNYTRAMNYGIKYLELNGIEYQDMVNKLGITNGIQKLFDEKLDSTDIKALENILFTAQSLASLVNLQKTKMKLLAQLPVAKSMYDWVCSKKPDIRAGACDMFYGAYESGRPRMLGGNPKKGKRIFLNLIKKSPENWLARLSYIQFYLVPMMDEEGYQEQIFYMEKATREYQENISWKPGTPRNIKKKLVDKNPPIYQAVAIKRYQIIKKYEKEIF